MTTTSQVAPPVGFELETNGFQFYAIVNLDKTFPNTCIACFCWVRPKIQT